MPPKKDSLIAARAAAAAAVQARAQEKASALAAAPRARARSPGPAAAAPVAQSASSSPLEESKRAARDAVAARAATRGEQLRTVDDGDDPMTGVAALPSPPVSGVKRRASRAAPGDAGDLHVGGGAASSARQVSGPARCKHVVSRNSLPPPSLPLARLQSSVASASPRSSRRQPLQTRPAASPHRRRLGGGLVLVGDDESDVDSTAETEVGEDDWVAGGADEEGVAVAPPEPALPSRRGSREGGARRQGSLVRAALPRAAGAAAPDLAPAQTRPTGHVAVAPSPSRSAADLVLSPRTAAAASAAAALTGAAVAAPAPPSRVHHLQPRAPPAQAPHEPSLWPLPLPDTSAHVNTDASPSLAAAAAHAAASAGGDLAGGGGCRSTVAAAAATAGAPVLLLVGAALTLAVAAVFGAVFPPSFPAAAWDAADSRRLLAHAPLDVAAASGAPPPLVQAVTPALRLVAPLLVALTAVTLAWQYAPCGGSTAVAGRAGGT